MKDVQKTEQEHQRQGELLASLESQTPDQGHRQGQNHEVYEQVRHSVPAEELVLIDTGPAVDRLIPKECDGLAFENCDKHVHEEIEYHDAPCECQFPSEPAGHAEKAVVQEDQGGFDRNGGGEVEDLKWQKDLEKKTQLLSRRFWSRGGGADFVV